MNGSLIGALPGGDLDIIGDVHGELASLMALLVELGYDSRGRHPQGRHLVFVGDLVDRGPHSASVVEVVAGLVETGRAQCILGNHELNLLRRDRKQGNEWFFDSTEAATQHAILEFIAQLPLALERGNLRIAHACWCQSAVDRLRSQRADALGLFESYEKASERQLVTEGLAAAAERQRKAHYLRDPEQTPPMLDDLARYQVRKQMDNPVAVITSGIERVAKAPFWANGKWRFAARVGWWEDYTAREEVVIGHYWRSRSGDHHFTEDAGLFGDAGATDTLGRAGRVMCIDYSIGQRAKERTIAGENGPFKSALAAYRVSSAGARELVFSPV